MQSADICSFPCVGGSYPACQQQPSAIGCSVVREANSDAIFRQFVGVSGTHHMVSFDLCISNLVKTDKSSHTISNLLQHEFHSVPQALTWQQMSLLENLTIILYLGVLYLFLSCTTSRFRAKKSVLPSVKSIRTND